MPYSVDKLWTATIDQLYYKSVDLHHAIGRL
jgi:hypothetical protein